MCVRYVNLIEAFQTLMLIKIKLYNKNEQKLRLQNKVLLNVQDFLIKIYVLFPKCFWFSFVLFKPYSCFTLTVRMKYHCVCLSQYHKHISQTIPGGVSRYRVVSRCSAMFTIQIYKINQISLIHRSQKRLQVNCITHYTTILCHINFSKDELDRSKYCSILQYLLRKEKLWC